MVRPRMWRAIPRHSTAMTQIPMRRWVAGPIAPEATARQSSQLHRKQGSI
ncbi:MAG: hypothetical protein WCQ65_11040 [Fermentimonas sp.]